jgi:hypothetical protein
MDLLSATVVGLVAMGYLGAIVYAITQIVKSPSLNDLERWAWVAAVVFFPLVAAVVWFAAGPHPLGLRLSNLSAGQHPRDQ